MNLPSDVWQIAHQFVGFRGKYLFLAPVCRSWYHTEAGNNPHTNFREVMASSSRIREAGKSLGGVAMLSRKNAWSYLAKKVHDPEIFESLANELEITVDWDMYSSVIAGKHGNSGFFRWLNASQKYEWDPELALSSAALAGRLPFLEQMCTDILQGFVPGKSTVTGAALLGSPDILKFLQKRGCDMEDVGDILAEEGHLRTLKWANSNGILIQPQILHAAAYGNHPDVVHYLRDLSRIGT